MLGLLDDTVTRTNFAVTPVLGRVEPHPYDFKPYDVEVAELPEVPLSHLVDPANHVPDPRSPQGPIGPFPSYKFGEHIIFGATARMTTEFLNIVRRDV